MDISSANSLENSSAVWPQVPVWRLLIHSFYQISCDRKACCGATRFVSTVIFLLVMDQLHKEPYVAMLFLKCLNINIFTIYWLKAGNKQWQYGGSSKGKTRI